MNKSFIIPSDDEEYYLLFPEAAEEWERELKLIETETKKKEQDDKTKRISYLAVFCYIGVLLLCLVHYFIHGDINSLVITIPGVASLALFVIGYFKKIGILLLPLSLRFACDVYNIFAYILTLSWDFMCVAFPKFMLNFEGEKEIKELQIRYPLKSFGVIFFTSIVASILLMWLWAYFALKVCHYALDIHNDQEERKKKKKSHHVTLEEFDI